MKIDKSQFLELLGNFAVVASLVFVGVQLMLDRQVALSSQYQNRSEIAIEFQRSQFESNEYISEQAILWELNRPGWWNSDLERLWNEPDSLKENMVREAELARMLVLAVDNNYYQYQNGFFEEEAWSSVLAIVRGNLQNPVPRAILLNAVSIRPATQRLIREIDNEL